MPLLLMTAVLLASSKEQHNAQKIIEAAQGDPFSS
jgi:hypothetical protein